MGICNISVCYQYIGLFKFTCKYIESHAVFYKKIGFFSSQSSFAGGKYAVPGFIDGHIHLESTFISPAEFSKIAAMHGTSAVITDPHELANVAGTDGIDYMLAATENLPIDVFFMIPSCVPASFVDGKFRPTSSA